MKEVDNVRLETLLLSQGIHWAVVDHVLRAPDAPTPGGGTSQKYWSRQIAEGEAQRGAQALAQKTLEDVLATAQMITAPA